MDMGFWTIMRVFGVSDWRISIRQEEA